MIPAAIFVLLIVSSLICPSSEVVAHFASGAHTKHVRCFASYDNVALSILIVFIHDSIESASTGGFDSEFDDF